MRKHYKCAVSFNGVEVKAEADTDHQVKGYMTNTFISGQS